MKDQDGVLVECECIKQKRKRHLFEIIGVPPRLRDMRLDNFEVNISASGANLKPQDIERKMKAKAIVSQYISSISDMLNGTLIRNSDGRLFNSIVLEGGNNSGKSLLSSCIAIQGVEGGNRARIFEWSQILDACYDFDGKEYDLMCDQMSRRDQVVIIENIEEMYEGGASQTSFPPSVLRRLNSMFLSRWKLGIPTVVTTSQDIKKITSGRYGSALTSVIKDAIWVELPAEEGN